MRCGQVFFPAVMATLVASGCGQEEGVTTEGVPKGKGGTVPTHSREYYLARLNDNGLPGHERTNALSWLIS